MSKGEGDIEDIVQALKAGGFRVTTSRVELLLLLKRANAPLSVQSIVELWKRNAPNITTLYRSLTDLSVADIVRRIDLNTGIAHFEYTPHRPHHHHIVCSECGKVEELEYCALGALETEIAKTSEQFTTIFSHTLEFFGRCTVCASR